jgi:hypothetical protein
VEVGRRISPRLPVAFEVADAQDVTEHLLIHPHGVGSLHFRLDAAACAANGD